MSESDKSAHPLEEPQDVRNLDRPRSIAALFENEAHGMRALVKLHEAGFTTAWLGVTKALTDSGGFSEIVREQGGGAIDAFVRLLSGDGGETLYAVLTNHGVADDVARRLQREMPDDGVIVVAGWTGDIREAARVLEEAGGQLERGADGGIIGTPRHRKPSHESPRDELPG
jgi:hypothetical protein